VPFLLLGLDLPATPLFQDNMERNAIPQVPLAVIMQKFDGSTVEDTPKMGRRRFSVLRLPRYLVLHMKVTANAHCSCELSFTADCMMTALTACVCFP
jgi:hypothetical protein